MQHESVTPMTPASGRNRVASARRFRRWARLSCHAFIALLVLLALGEFGTRLCIGGPSPHLYDPEIGYRYRPGSELFQSKEGFSRTRFNELGLNDVPIAPTTDVCRVLVVGDSYTAALQLPMERNFTSIAERL